MNSGEIGIRTTHGAFTPSHIPLLCTMLPPKSLYQAILPNYRGTVRTQIGIAISVYVLVDIVKKRFNTEVSLYTILQILSLILFEKIPIGQLVKNTEVQMDIPKSYNHLNLFN